MAKPRVQLSRLKPTEDFSGNARFITTFDGKDTTIYFSGSGTVYGPALCRLAKAIVRRFEQDKKSIFYSDDWADPDYSV